MKNTNLRWFIIVSPEMSYTEVVLDDGTGPTYGVCDLALVGSYTRQEAKWAAWNIWKREGSQWYDEATSDHIHPLSGVKIQQEIDCPTEKFIDSWRPWVYDPRVED